MGDHHPFPVDIRIITATNRNLENMIKKGNFREDLFFRINVFPIQCPPLTDRKEDIPLIVENFINRICTKNHKPILGISSEAMETFLEYHWPGNVRELRNAIEYAAVLCTQGIRIPEDI